MNIKNFLENISLDLADISLVLLMIPTILNLSINGINNWFFGYDMNYRPKYTLVYLISSSQAQYIWNLFLLIATFWLVLISGKKNFNFHLGLIFSIISYFLAIFQLLIFNGDAFLISVFKVTIVPLFTFAFGNGLFLVLLFFISVAFFFVIYPTLLSKTFSKAEYAKFYLLL